MNISQLAVRVYYEDTDAGGVVYHARYLHFFERARTEYLRQMNFSQQQLLNEHNIAFVVKTMHIDYKIAARLDDLLLVETEVTEVRGATILFEQKLKRNEQILSTAQVKIACVDMVKMKAMALPDMIKSAFLS
ncbi:tol-pal system-associated acyl-CoA thioesterase [Seminibacterium arietis]|uniref:Tol-pal system-associated acyl-CoA thioesterase n=1 Tax=Seminibacterium arietis TaxID=1173502 RepID=A0ABW3I7U0_9PAST